MNNPKAAYQETIYDPGIGVAFVLTTCDQKTYGHLEVGGLCHACSDAAAGRRNVAVYRSYA